MAAIVNLSNTLNIKVVAEGIEIDAEVTKLKEYQCAYGQGYFYDKALPIDLFESKYMQEVDQVEEAIIN